MIILENERNAFVAGIYSVSLVALALDDHLVQMLPKMSVVLRKMIKIFRYPGLPKIPDMSFPSNVVVPDMRPMYPASYVCLNLNRYEGSSDAARYP